MSDHPVIYLNNATSSHPKCEEFIQIYLDVLRRPPRDIRHTTAGPTDVDHCKAIIAGAIGIKAEHLFFTADATTGLNMILQGYLSGNDRCVVDNRTHNAITRTLFGMEDVKWTVVRLIDHEENLILQNLTEVDPRTKLFCLTHASNVTGSIYDVELAIGVVREAFPDAAVLIDASQSAGIEDLRCLDRADFAVFAAHKFLHAPPGAALLTAKRQLRQTVFGGTGVRSADLQTRESNEILTEVGTPNAPALIAFAAAIDAAQKGLAERKAVLRELTCALWDGLSAIPGVTLFGRTPNARRTPVIAISTPGIDPERAWMPYLASCGIIARGGLHCCPLFHDEVGLLADGSLRFSPSIFTTLEEVQLTVAAVDAFVGALR